MEDPIYSWDRDDDSYLYDEWDMIDPFYGSFDGEYHDDEDFLLDSDIYFEDEDFFVEDEDYSLDDD